MKCETVIPHNRSVKLQTLASTQLTLRKGVNDMGTAKAAGATVGSVFAAILLNLVILVPVLVVASLVIHQLTKPNGGYSKMNVWLRNRKSAAETKKANKVHAVTSA